MRVSIHAPAGGATCRPLAFCRTRQVSIHAPAGGATLRAHLLKRPNRFHSTRPQGARLGEQVSLDQQCGVSIHAPAGGATKSLGFAWVIARFQSTRPQGARRQTSQGQTSHGRFNPRARRGRDTIIRRSHTKMRLKFQSTRPQGARLSNCNIRHFMVLTTP